MGNGVFFITLAPAPKESPKSTSSKKGGKRKTLKNRKPVRH